VIAGITVVEYGAAILEARLSLVTTKESERDLDCIRFERKSQVERDEQMKRMTARS
jgi:hypothetical protein